MRWAARLAGLLLFVPALAAAQDCPLIDWAAQEKARKECIATGGEWSRFGARDAMCNLFSCAPRTADGGKPCQGHLDCEHLCLDRKEGPLGAPAEGRCAAVKTSFGCQTHVNGGRVVGRVCLE